MIVPTGQPKNKIVEWVDSDGPHKVILPVESDDVTLGVPVGYPFEYVEMPDINAASVARALRSHGIWTARDLRGNVKAARAAILDLTNQILTALLNSIREVER